MKIVCISDTHLKVDKWDVGSFPDGDVLIHSGDFCNSGAKSDLIKFSQFIKRCIGQYQHIVIIPGNHDIVAQDFPDYTKEILSLDTVHYLNDSSVIIDGVKFYGTPWQNEFFDWAFNLPHEGKEIEEKFSKIPDDTNVLLCHSPLFEILDKTARGECVGSQKLRLRIDELSALNNLKLINHGHIHEGYGKCTYKNIQIVNSSLVNQYYQYTNDPITIEI